jgi:hypothetical protein
MVAEPLTEPFTAVIVVDPCVSVLTCPVESTTATARFEELHVEDALRNSEVPSLSTPMAVKTSGRPAVTVELCGVT